MSSAKSRALRQAYSDGDLLSVGAALLDELTGNLTQGVEHETASGAVVRLRPSPDEQFKLAGTFARVVDQLRLIRGRSTANVDMHVTMTAAQRDTLRRSEEANAATMRQLGMVG